MKTVNTGDMNLILFVTQRIGYYKLALKTRTLAEIVQKIDKLRDNSLKFDYPAETLLHKTHAICRKVQTGIARDTSPCLVRCLVLYEICLRQKIPADLVIGAGKLGQELRGHAWIELNGLPYRESNILSDYTEMIRYTV